jgi:hypothetical protein
VPANLLRNTFTPTKYSSSFFIILKQATMNTIEKKSVNVGVYVSKNEMDTLTGAYKQERWADNSERLGKADSLSVWFTVEEVEAFLAKVKANGGNGVRFHYGVFNAENAPEPEFEGRQTLVMAGNRSSDGTYNSSKQLFSNNNGKPEIVALAGGILCPPFCGTGGGGIGKSTVPALGSSVLIDRGEKGMSVI